MYPEQEEDEDGEGGLMSDSNENVEDVASTAAAAAVDNARHFSALRGRKRRGSAVSTGGGHRQGLADFSPTARPRPPDSESSGEER